MPGFVVHQGATVQCSHQGPAQPSAVAQRVTVGGNPISVQPHPYTISNCQWPNMTAYTQPPCVTASWTTVAQRVFAGNMPVVVFDSQSVAQPNSTPLLILQTQTRVTAS